MDTARRSTASVVGIIIVLALGAGVAPLADGAGGDAQLPVPPIAPPGPGVGASHLPAFGLRGLDAGSFHTCGVDRRNRAWCWGLNDRGQLGTGASGDPQSRPVSVGSAFNTYRQISAGGSGRVLPNNPGGAPRLESHTCGVTLAGAIECWGANGFGQLGNGSFEDAAVPVPIFPLGVRFREVSAGGLHTCALSEEFDVYCWGANGRAQLGEDTGFRSSAFPRRAFNAGTFLTVSAGGFFTCGSSADQTQCWGDNSWGQLGSGTAGGFSIVPLSVGGGASVTGVSAGFEHACAIGSDGAAHCWGRGELLQLGSSFSLETCFGLDCSSWPVEVVGFFRFRQVSAGGTHTCGLTQNHLVLCWGHNETSELGIGTRSIAEYPATNATLGGETSLPGRSGRTLWIEWRGQAVSAGGNHSCALAQNSTPFCWGRNDFGQVGAGTAPVAHRRPVAIAP